MTGKIYVHTIGDAFDNLFHLLKQGSPVEEAKRDSVEGQLQSQLNALGFPQGKAYEVVSHAYAGFSGSSVLSGDIVGKTIHDYMREKAQGSRFIQPLEILQAKISENPKANHYVVISLEKRFTPSTAPINQYLEIVDRVQKMGGKPILMLAYRPEATNDHERIYSTLAFFGGVVALVNAACIVYLGRFGMQTLVHRVSPSDFSIIVAITTAVIVAGTFELFGSGRIRAQVQHPGMMMMKFIIEARYRPILERAKKDQLPIIDLPNTFDPYKTELYISGSEPSKKGGALIAKAICQAVQDEHHDDSYIYTDQGYSINNPTEWCIKV